MLQTPQDDNDDALSVKKPLSPKVD